MTPRFRESIILGATSHYVPNLITESRVKTKPYVNNENQGSLKESENTVFINCNIKCQKII